MVDLIYYYPQESGAPSQVARNLFSAIMKKDTPFSIAVVTQNENDARKLKAKYDKIQIVSIKQLSSISEETLVHFTVSPFVFPNKKFLMYLISRFKHNKLMINYHGEPRTEFKIGFANHRVNHLLNLPNYLCMPYLIKTADVLVLNSTVMSELFYTIYGSTSIKVIPNGIDASWLNFENDTKNIKEINKDIYIFFHGRLSPEKGVDILFKGFSKVLNECTTNKPSLMLYIAGDGPQIKNLEKLSMDLRINENVRFLGKIPISNLKSYLYNADAAFYPSTYEPFSLAVLEAFAISNGPVMYADNMGINDFVKHDGYRFYTFSPTVEGIADAIKCIISKRYDPTIHRKQKEFASKYTWDKVAQQYIDLYSKIL